MEQKETTKMDSAARAGWLYYVAGYTQDQIAIEFGISRQSAQRLVSLSISEKLIKVRLDHPITTCMNLAKQLKEKFDLKECNVIPSISDDKNSVLGLGQAGAKMMEKYLDSKKPMVIAVGTGKVLNMIANELTPKNTPHHKVIALVGNMTNDGSASAYEVVSKIAEKIKSTYYPMPLPVIVSSQEERNLLHNLHSTKNILNLSKQIDVSFVGIGQFDDKAPLYSDSFINQNELNSLIDCNASGEIIGWAFDRNGKIINCPINKRVTSIPLDNQTNKLIIATAAGEHKYKAIKAALLGKLINGLITNEMTAQFLLK
jgi:DNA-binding transcriptional regulator LsrR (DeoR family)